MKTLDFLKANEFQGNESSLKNAQFLKDNWDWLKYSFAIAIRVRRRMSELGWTQKRLAEALGCTQQHISILLNGKVNMTLETLAKLENALQFSLIKNVLAYSDGYSYPVGRVGYLNEPSVHEDSVTCATSDLVSGYSPRKKKGPKKK